MPFNLSDWLFDSAVTVTADKSRYFLPYLIFCGVGLLIWFYYWVEGRKRFVKSKPILKYMLDRYLNWLAIICFIGIPIALAWLVLPGYFFAWRLWRYLWLVALVVWAVLWIVYLVRKYPNEKANYLAYEKQQQYVPNKSRPKSKSKRRRNARTAASR